MGEPQHHSARPRANALRHQRRLLVAPARRSLAQARGRHEHVVAAAVVHAVVHERPAVGCQGYSQSDAVESAREHVEVALGRPGREPRGVDELHERASLEARVRDAAEHHRPADVDRWISVIGPEWRANAVVVVDDVDLVNGGKGLEQAFTLERRQRRHSERLALRAAQLRFEGGRRDRRRRRRRRRHVTHQATRDGERIQ